LRSAISRAYDAAFKRAFNGLHDRDSSIVFIRTDRGRPPLPGTGGRPFHPLAVRATLGSLFAQQFVRTTLPEFLAWKQRHQCRLVGTAPSGIMDYHAARYRSPALLFMGGEREGLDRDDQARCDPLVKIPRVGGCDSLNLGIATGVMLYELFNQRREDRRAPAAPGPAPPGAPRASR
jgi:tRNA(Leu) C34 or U34 (ribose-2'-O)-methylase TrmL